MYLFIIHQESSHTLCAAIGHKTFKYMICWSFCLFFPAFIYCDQTNHLNNDQRLVEKMSNQSQRLFRLFGGAASILGRRYLRSSPRSRLIFRQVVLCTGGGLAAATAWASVASTASTEFMAEPISGQDSLKSNDMKARMESLIMQVQAEFCRALEKEEEENSLDEKPQKFKVKIAQYPIFYLTPFCY